MQSNDLLYYIARYLQYFPFLFPLGFIGVWRWSVWTIKKVTGAFYKPTTTPFKTSVSLITPVYNEDPVILTKALQSWKQNKPQEIIAVIDFSDKSSIALFKKFAKKNKNARLIVTKKPGKRPALADGIKVAKGDVVALVDSDTIWEADTLKNGITPFKDKKIGGVASKQSIYKPQTIAQKLFSIRLEQRYWDDIPFLTVAGDVLVCLSGRTAFYRKKAVMPFLNDLVNEFFLGKRVISGEDKRLTYLIERAGWKATYQSNSRVSTPGEAKLGTFLNQQIRWTRNSWRADLKALREGWVFKHPVFALYLIDRAIQPFTLLISPIYFIVSAILGLWLPVAVITVWWFISRGIKMYPHLKKYPLDIWILPIFILFNFVSAYIRLYALFSLNTQGWITRWDKSRLPQFTRLSLLAGHVMTLFLFMLVAALVVVNKQQNYIIPEYNRQQLVTQTFPVSRSLIAKNTNGQVLGASTLNPEVQLAKSHAFVDGESLYTIAQNNGVTFDNLLTANVQKITNWNRIKSGTLLTIPPQNVNLVAAGRFNYRRLYDDVLNIYFDTAAGTIVVMGRGYTVSLSDIARAVGTDYLEEVAPQEWYLKSNIYLRSGTTLKMDNSDVKWLKMKSDSKGYVSIRSFNADVLINGVKVTSWDKDKNTYDTKLEDGRSYVLVKDGSRMDIINSEMAYLGFPRPETLPYSSYGVSWRMSTGKRGTTILTGEVIASTFHHNYFGAYTYGATGMTWKNNTFHSNVRYGLDPHDDSNGFLVENNKAYDNGSHGIIFSKRCINNIIRNNISYNNKLHGIMLHQKSDNNLIENNRLYDNRDGVALDDSNNNVIRNNLITNNDRGVRANNNSKNNLIEKNTIKDSKQYGVYFYKGGDTNVVRENILESNKYGAYVKTSGNEFANNTIIEGNIGVYILNAENNSLSDNIFNYNKSYGVYAKINQLMKNPIETNSFLKNFKRDIYTHIISKNN